MYVYCICSSGVQQCKNLDLNTLHIIDLDNNNYLNM